MSSDQDRGAPSFGDLFDDPDSSDVPDAPALAPTPTADTGAGDHHSEPQTDQVSVARNPQAPPTTIEVSDDLTTGHDLEHESDEASHLVAGFEHDDSGSDDPPAPGYDSVMIAPLAGVMLENSDAATPPAADRPAPVTVAPAAGVLAAARATQQSTGKSWDGVVDPAISSAPAARVDTGRLYRSSGAEGPATLDAIPAIDPSYTAAQRVEAVADRRTSLRTGGLTYPGVAVVVIATTVVVAFIEALLRKEIGVLTGVALLGSSVYAALVVRRVDIWAAVVMPPLAFLVATLTAGQLTQTRTGHFFIDQGSLLLLVLGRNALWVLGTSLVCLVIVLVRRRRP